MMVRLLVRSMMERLLVRSLVRLLVWSPERLLVRSLVRLLVWLPERLLVWSPTERSLVRSPLKQLLRGKDASESIGLMNCLLMWQSDPKRSQRPRRPVAS